MESSLAFLLPRARGSVSREQVVVAIREEEEKASTRKEKPYPLLNFGRQK